jgi:TrmH family RNA methyltransferase
MYIENLSSAKNPRIKELLELKENSHTRRNSGLFTVEGKRELQLCVKGGFEIESVFFHRDLVTVEEVKEIRCRGGFSVTPQLYSKIAYREGTEGIIAIVRERKIRLSSFTLSATPLIIVLESVEKPGNLGAVLRTADAARADAVIICDPLTDLYNPNIIRSSTGAIFTTQTTTTSSADCYSWLKENNIAIITTELEASDFYHLSDLTKPAAIVMGSESDGLTSFWREKADMRIKIPMNGYVDSLNVSVTTAIICFEALRQRGFKF